MGSSDFTLEKNGLVVWGCFGSALSQIQLTQGSEKLAQAISGLAVARQWCTRKHQSSFLLDFAGADSRVSWSRSRQLWSSSNWVGPKGDRQLAKWPEKCCDRGRFARFDLTFWRILASFDVAEGLGRDGQAPSSTVVPLPLGVVAEKGRSDEATMKRKRISGERREKVIEEERSNSKMLKK